MRRETSIDIVLESSEVRIKVPCRRLRKLLTRLRRRRRVLSRSFLTGIRIKWSMWIINLIDGSESSLTKISVIREWFLGCVLFWPWTIKICLLNNERHDIGSKVDVDLKIFLLKLNLIHDCPHNIHLLTPEHMIYKVP
jgi:hypothetical protein